MTMDSVRPAPTTAYEWMSYVGLGSRKSRAAFFALAAAGISYATKLPSQFYGFDGHLKKFGVTPTEDGEGEDDDSPPPAQPHFILVPLAGAVIGYYFL